MCFCFFFFSSRRRHTRCLSDWSSDVCSSDLFWLDQGQYNEVWNFLEEAQVAVNKVFNDKQRSEVMRRLAVILARLHSYRAARETAEQCSRSSDRLVAYTAILREYHIERDPSLARLFAEEKIGSGR